MPTPDRTSLEAIVSAGRDILEASGPGGLTMNAVAERVGVKAPSLYKRVRDKDALFRLVADATISDLTTSLHGPTLRDLAVAMRSFAQTRPQGFRAIFTTGASPEAIAAASEPVLRACRNLVGEERALDAARTVTSWAYGFITMEMSGAFQLGGDIDSAFEAGIDLLTQALSEPQARA